MKSISPSELKNLITNNKAIIIDVREGFENKACSIKDSILMPSTSFDEDKMPKIHDKKIVIHCKSGGRSSMIINKMKNKECYNLEGGIQAWIGQGFEVQKAPTKCLPLDRQVQLTIGVALILSFVLTYFVNINLAFITLLIGCGLCFAGTTGFCGLAVALAKAPWNKIYSDKNIKSCNLNTNQ